MEPTSSKRIKSEISLSSGRKTLIASVRDPPLLSNKSRKKGRSKGNKQKKRKRSEPQYNQDEFILKSILREEVRQGKLYYLIDWEGIDPATGKAFEHTWYVGTSFASRIVIDLAYPVYRSQQRTRMRKQLEIGILRKNEPPRNTQTRIFRYSPTPKAVSL
jgi:hypothetical protein